MKFLTLIFLAFALNANAFIGNIGHSTNLDYAGAVVAQSVEKNFINVKANGAIAAGKWVGLDLTADDGGTVVVGPVSGLGPLCVMVADCADGKLCLCQTYGLYDTALFDVGGGGPAIAGYKAMIATSTAGYISQKVGDTSSATSTAVGIFYDAAAASGSVQIFIKL